MNETNETVETAEEVKAPVRMYNLTLSETNLNQILSILGDQPYVKTSELIALLFSQSKPVTEEKAA